MKQYFVKEIGTFMIDGEVSYIQVYPEYRKALQALEGFSHLSIIWWFSDFDGEEMRTVLESPRPYKNAPEIMGIFATRSPIRPNPLALSTVEVLSIDGENGKIQITWTDANHGTPVLDIKPYTPSSDRIENPKVPYWCENWPKSYEESGDFDWSEVFLFNSEH